MFYIVPDDVAAEIDSRLNAELKKCPDAEKDRDHLRSQLINAFVEYGYIPDFSLTKNPGGSHD